MERWVSCEKICGCARDRRNSGSSSLESDEASMINSLKWFSAHFSPNHFSPNHFYSYALMITTPPRDALHDVTCNRSLLTQTSSMVNRLWQSLNQRTRDDMAPRRRALGTYAAQSCHLNICIGSRSRFIVTILRRSASAATEDEQRR